ncbi:hypothetical protein MBLNU230_g4471t1 [Neophaeotheca triangularis]
MDFSDASSLTSLGSSPLSSRASTPTPPPDLNLPPSACRKRPFRDNIASSPYPSPPASQDASQNGSPAPDQMPRVTGSAQECPPPAKRRRLTTERTTEYLDLSQDKVLQDEQLQLDRLLKVLHKSQKIVVIAGAGISVSAGIPDFRSSTGLFTSLKSEHKLKGSGKHLFDASVYKDDTSTSSFHSMVSSMSRLTRDAKPTAFHHMLATIASEDRLLRLYSQNVDGIDTSLDPLSTSVPLRKGESLKWPRTVQLHGGLSKMVCSKCHEISDFDSDLFSGPTPPLCSSCEEINDIRTNHEGKRSHGIGRLRPRMVLYNEHNPDDEAIGAVTRDDLRKRPDAVIVVGTTMKVPGVRRIVREMCGVVRNRRGGVAVWINNDPPPVGKEFEDCWDIVVRGTSDEVASRAAMRHWDDTDSFAAISDEDAKKAEARRMEVRLPSKSEDGPAHLPPLAVPSDEHKNNSFPPPTPSRKHLERTSPVLSSDFSPMPPSRKSSVTTSIEQSSREDNIDVAVSNAGLLTPTKSQKGSSPSKKAPTINERLKAAAPKANKTAAKGGKASKKAQPKKSNVKYVKPAASKAKKPKVGAKGSDATKSNALTNTFAASKATISTGEAKDEKAGSLDSSYASSKLRFASNAPTHEPMHTLPPQDAKSNASPRKLSMAVGVHSYSVTSENESMSKKRDRMSVASLMN